MNVESFFKEARAAKTADMVINNSLRQLKERSKCLSMYCPLVEKPGRQWLAYITTTVDPIASLVAQGTEFPSARKGDFSTVQARNYKAAISYHWDEEVQQRIAEVSEIAKLRNISIQNIEVSEGKVQLGQDNELAKVLFGSLASLVRGHINLIDYLAWQVFQTGAMNYTDFRSGLSINLDWKKTMELRKNHFPQPIYQNKNLSEDATSLARDWTAFATADPLQDLVDMHYTYKFTNGFAADEIVMSEQLFLTMLRSKAVKEAVVTANTLGNQITGTPSVDQVNEAMRRRFLPTITLVDDQVEMGAADGSTTYVRLHDVNRVTFLSKKAQAQRILGGTLENKGRAGIYARTWQKSEAPPLDITDTASMQLVAAPSIGKTGMSRIVAKKPALDLVMNLADFEL